MFGDIITDLAAGLQGGLGMAASGNLHLGKTSMLDVYKRQTYDFDDAIWNESE